MREQRRIARERQRAADQRRKRRRHRLASFRRLPKRARGAVKRKTGAARKRRRASRKLVATRRAARSWERQLTALKKDSRTPIVIGPWTNEIGYELLYWIPLLRHAFAKHSIDPERVVAVSRGGVESWYEPIAGRYVEIHDLIESEQLYAAVERRNNDQGGQRQLAVTYEDLQLVREAAATLGLESYRTLHPVAAYSLLTGYLRGLRPAKEILRQCDHSRFPARYSRPEGLPVDGDYLVAKFYANPAFPHTEENQGFVDEVLRRLSARLPVVLLNTGLALDDHSEFALPDLPDVYDARELLRADDNLGVQTALTACSRGFVGTYGGFSYLAPLLGLPGVGIYSSTQFVPVHLASASVVFGKDGLAGYSAIHTSGYRMLDALPLAAPVA